MTASSIIHVLHEWPFLRNHVELLARDQLSRRVVASSRHVYASWERTIVQQKQSWFIALETKQLLWCSYVAILSLTSRNRSTRNAHLTALVSWTDMHSISDLNKDDVVKSWKSQIIWNIVQEFSDSSESEHFSLANWSSFSRPIVLETMTFQIIRKGMLCTNDSTRQTRVIRFI